MNNYKPAQVGELLCHNKIRRYLTYRNIEKDENQWVLAKDFLPISFDLCKLKLSSGKVKMGWYTGSGWDGYQAKDSDHVIFWKKIKDG